MKKSYVIILLAGWLYCSGIYNTYGFVNADLNAEVLSGYSSIAGIGEGGGLNGNGGKDKNKGKGCKNPSHDHSKDKDGGKNCNSKDKGDKDGDGKGNGKDKSCDNPSHDHSKDKDGGKNCNGKDKDGKDKDDQDEDGDNGDNDGSNGGGSDQQPTCEGNSFSTSIVNKKEVTDTCVEYEIKVSYDGTRSFGLSHFSIGIPCGEVKNISNSENWKQVFGKDPTTGVYGLKIDDINGFGEKGADSFTIKFTWCGDASCEKMLGVVSYKAGQCIDYDTLQDSGNDNGGGSEDDGSGDGDGNDGDSGGDGTDDDGDNPPDSVGTCSTLIARLQKTNVSCAGSSNGQLQVVITDGQEPYTYAWSTGETSATIQNLTAGNYSVTVTDAKDNTMTLAESIIAAEAIAISETLIHPTCSGSTNGAISLLVAGGSGAYTFSWSNGTTQQDLVNLGSGSYTVVVSDSAGCSAQKTFTLENSTSITVGVSFTHPACGQSNGIIDITPAGGVVPYTYLWSTGATTQDLSNGIPGTYTVKITDASGCSLNMQYALRINNTLALKYVVSPTRCADDGSGAIDLTVTGGTAPYTYLWQDGITTEDRIGLKSGLYKVTVTDASGCSSSINISVFKKTFTVTSEVVQPKCAGDLGSITVNPVDGVSPYTYSWNTGDTGNSQTGVGPGTYSVNITDASGCSVTMVFLMPTLVAISATSEVSNTQCGSEDAFTIDLSVSGGMSPYTYEWSGGATTQDVSGLQSGTYTVKITDANGCSVTKEVVVNQVSVSWSCLINQPTKEVVCKSAGNILTTSMEYATTYHWTVSSADHSWEITAGSASSAVVYTAGNAGSSATFTLIITKDGCSKSCTYTISSTGCIERDNTGGGDPLADDPCASDTTNTITKEIALDSTTVATASNSSTTQQSDENEETPEKTEVESLDDSMITELQVNAYPNPFTDRVNFEWTSNEDDYVQVEILDVLGRRTSVIFRGPVQKGNSYSCDWSPTGTDRLYLYRYQSSKKMEQGKLLMK